MRSFVSILLSFLLLLSSSGLSYAQHFCGEYMMDAKITLGEKHLSCGMVMELPGCEDSSMEKPGCCENEYTQVDLDENFAKASFDLDLQWQWVFVPMQHSFQPQQTVVVKVPVVLNNHDPPEAERYLFKRYETFLI